MHTQKVVYEDEVKYEGGKKVVTKTRTFYVHHHGDWSGDAIVVEEDGTPDGKRIELPGIIFQVCGRNATITDAISALEDLMVGPEGK